MNYFRPYGLFKLKVIGWVTFASLSMGAFGLLWWGGFTIFAPCNIERRTTVLAAAPVNMMRVFTAILESTRLKGPPPYVNTGLVNVAAK